MTAAGIVPDLQELFQAPGLSQLRARLGDQLAQLGYWGVCEYHGPLLVNRASFELGDRLWDNFDERVGRHGDGLLHTLLGAAAARGVGGEDRRARWIADQRRPFLVISGAAIQFESHDPLSSLGAAFGRQVVDALLFPIVDLDAWPRRIWALAEGPDALEKTIEALALLTVYEYVSRYLQEDGSPGGRDRGNHRDRQGVLTPRQCEVLRWAAAGKTPREIALITGLTVRTVRFHMQSARLRYGLKTTQQTIVRAALDYGFDPSGPG